MNTKHIIYFLFFALLITAVPSQSFAIQAVASVKHLNGNVQVIREDRKIPGEEGLILNDQDVIETGKRAKATIIFRDGSEIRLFQKTRFVIEKSEETSSGSRKFFNSFRLKLGSFWGRFTKGRQNTNINTPTATIGIKGTNVSFSQSAKSLDVSLSSGRISVENYDEKIMLDGGYKLTGIKEDGKISDKKSALAYEVVIKPDKMKLNIPDKGEENTVYFTIQLTHSKSKKNWNKSGTVYLSSEVDKLTFPKVVRLNKRGYKRVKATLTPFQKVDYQDGKFVVFAVMDGEEYMDVSAGQAILTYDIPKDVTKTIQINMSTGQVK